MDRPSRRAVVPTFLISLSFSAQDIDRVRVGFPVSQVIPATKGEGIYGAASHARDD